MHSLEVDTVSINFTTFNIFYINRARRSLAAISFPLSFIFYNSQIFKIVF